MVKRLTHVVMRINGARDQLRAHPWQAVLSAASAFLIAFVIISQGGGLSRSSSLLLILSAVVVGLRRRFPVPAVVAQLALALAMTFPADGPVTVGLSLANICLLSLGIERKTTVVVPAAFFAALLLYAALRVDTGGD